MFKIEKYEEKELEAKVIASIKSILGVLNRETETQDILTVFQALCLPFNNGKGYKEQVILKLLNYKKIEARYEDGIGIIVPSKSQDKKIVVMSHIDLIPLFNKVFSQKREAWQIDLNLKNVVGALDNTFTNAVSLLILLKHPELLERVEFVFTENEEINLGGAKNYMKKYHKETNFYINLDVTNDNWGCNASIEYDKPSYAILKQLGTYSKFGLTKQRFTDDLDAVLNKGGNGFSYCLPTKGEIHSLNNKAKIKTILPYFQGLYMLLESLNIEDSKPDIGFFDIKTAISFETKEELEKAKEKTSKQVDLYGDEEDEEIVSPEFFADSLETFIQDDMGLKTGINFKDFVIYNIEGKGSFTRKDFLKHVSISEDRLNEALYFFIRNVKNLYIID